MASSEGIGRARAAFDRRQWARALAALSACDRISRLGADDLERLATASYLVGQDAEAVAAWTRLHQLCVARHALDRAARWGFWLSLVHFLAGEPAHATG